MELISVRDKGDMIEALTRIAEQQGIKDAAVVSVVGAVRTFTLSTMKADNPREAVLTSGRLAELSGNGEITDGVPNLHVTCGLEGGQALAGHLYAAEVGGPYFVNVYLHRL
ncbi:PCC domain-containing protein [Streptacidiphilus sp. N1-3]|uniref:PCC domain-containing protein n=1 Tax=Streptacidiphilus alkalitolerans TaxID=3342712 RepID=A0ABV6X3I7_9ACTN